LVPAATVGVGQNAAGAAGNYKAQNGKKQNKKAR